VAAYQRQQVAQQNRQQKIDDMQGLIAQFRAIVSVHQGQFLPATRPIAEWPPVPTVEDLYPDHEHQALAGIGPLHPNKKKEARVKAQLDAFEDNEAPAAAVGMEGSEVTVVVLAPDFSVIPLKWPEMTAAGNPSMKPLAKGKRTNYYNILVLGEVLVTVRETFAVAPSVQSVRAALLRRSPPDAYGKEHAECLAAAHFTRQALDGVRWDTADAGTIFNGISTERLFKQIGASGELKPLDLKGEPDLQALLATVDLSELEAG
jgi:hypothetical protein